MVAQEFFDLLVKFHPANGVGVEDFCDRFNFHFTVVVLLLCTIVVTVKQYLLRPISCYVSTSPGGYNFISYVENYCWIHGTNPFSLKQILPINTRHWDAFDNSKVYYYQWIPFVLGLQAVMFYLPRILWQLVTYNRTGTDITNVISTAVQANCKQLAEREKLIDHVTKSLEQMLYHYREHRRGPFSNVRRVLHRFCFGLVISKRLGTWLVMWYLITKILYFLNAVGQIYFMQMFLGLGTNYTYFGYDIARDLISGRDWQKTMVFPRVTFCHVPFKHIGNVNGLVAQCVLPINMLNEKIYIFLWFWIVLCFLITGLSIPIWLFRISYQKNNSRFLRKYLVLAGTLTRKEKPLVDKFAKQFLRHDGMFLIRMISLNAGDVVTADIVTQLWKIYLDRYKHRDFRDDGRLEEMNGLNGDVIRLDDGVGSVMCIPSAPDMDNANPSSSDLKLQFKVNL